MLRGVIPGLLSIVFLGCGASEEERPSLQPVQGTLTINGKPAQGATVVLHPADGKNFDSRGTRPKGTVADDGTFKVTTYQAGDGAPVGEYAVAVLWYGKDGNSTADWLNGTYAVPDQTGIRIMVQNGNSQLEPIEITGARLTAPRPSRPGKDLDGLGS